MTVDDWGAVLWCQLCSRGERSRTRVNRKRHHLRGVQLTFTGGGGWVWVSECAFACSLLPGGRQLISAALRRKTGQYVGAKMCHEWGRILRSSDLHTLTRPQDVPLYCATSHCCPTLGDMEMQNACYCHPKYCSMSEDTLSCLFVEVLQANRCSWQWLTNRLNSGLPKNKWAWVLRSGKRVHAINSTINTSTWVCWLRERPDLSIHCRRV